MVLSAYLLLFLKLASMCDCSIEIFHNMVTILISFTRQHSDIESFKSLKLEFLSQSPLDHSHKVRGQIKQHMVAISPMGGSHHSILLPIA